MTLQTYTILYLNLVCEMIYVVAERLKTQQIPIGKSKLVLNDIIAASFNNPLLFTPASIINRDILNKNLRIVVHSSIMRLNEPSMDKLLGLIETSVKMHMFSSNSPRQVLLLTLNHLDSIRNLACTNQLKQSIDLVQHNFYQTFEKMTDGEIMRLRYAVLNYLQDVHVKVTVFIKEGLQRYNGSFVSSGKWAVPYGCEAPGIIRVFDKIGTLIDISTFHPISFYKVETEVGSIKPNSPRITTLGLSVFNINKNINEPTEALDPLFNGQTGRDGYKQEMDLFVTQLMGNGDKKVETMELDLEILETSLNTNKKKIEEEKSTEHKILDFSQNTSNLSLQNLRTEMDDSVSRKTEDILNMMQLLDIE